MRNNRVASDGGGTGLKGAREYVAPKLRIFGEVGALTQSGTGNMQEGGGQGGGVGRMRFP